MAGDTWHFVSTDNSNTLIELYTSEGCNSCPPAEDYLNGLSGHPGLWKNVFPVAFHVDYWNYLGWRDRYSKAQFSARQRSYARELDKLFVYTPQLLLNGKPWRPGFFKNALPIVEAKTGTLDVTLENGRVQAQYRSLDTSPTAYDLHLAILGLGLHSSIKAGENEGREARHEFVVLGLDQRQSRDKGSPVSWQLQLPRVKQTHGAKQQALVVWVSKAGTYTPLQVVGGLIP